MIHNLNSHLTAKERDKPSFPTKWLFRGSKLRGDILDFGCGFGKDGEFLKSEGFSCTSYDKYYQPDYPNKKYDTIICNYVLNVLLPEEQADVLMSVSELLKPTGRAYFTVRRDLKYAGFRKHKIHKRKTYQCNVTLPFKTLFKNKFCEIYEYRHFNQLENNSSCIFDNPGSDTKLLSELATVYSIFDKYPVSNGHALVIPKRHTENMFELSNRELKAVWLMINRIRGILEREFSPDGFNIGTNIGRVSGQTVFHTHIHIIPRYKDDVDNPTGGVRNVIPGKGDYNLK